MLDGLDCSEVWHEQRRKQMMQPNPPVAGGRLTAPMEAEGLSQRLSNSLQESSGAVCHLRLARLLQTILA